MARLWVGLILAGAVGGCAVGPNYHTPEARVPANWSGPTPTVATTQPGAPTTQPGAPPTQPTNLATWWEALNDPALDDLVAQAVQANFDLQVAAARVREARALRDVAAADFWPQFNFGAGYTYSGSSENVGPSASGGGAGPLRSLLTPPTVSLRPGSGSTGATATITPQRITVGGNRRPSVTVQPGSFSIPSGASPPTVSIGPGAGAAAQVSRQQNLFQLGFDATWELDVFGGTPRAVEATEADLAAAENGHRDVLVTLISEVALNYVQLRGAQRRLAIAEENIAAQSDTFAVTRDRHRAGFTNELDVTQAAAQLATTQSQVPLLETAIRQAIYQLSVLLGEPPGTLVDQLDRAAPLPANPPAVPLGMPSDLLRRRPDVRAAERQLAAATARVGVATADLFPKFNLSGSFGPQVSDFRHILDARSLAWSIGPGVNWSIFDGGRIRANIQVQDARQEEALATYEQTVLTALQDVENALVAYTSELKRHGALSEAVASNQKSVELSNDLYVRGLGAFLNVLDSERNLYASQDQLVQSETTAITNLISLYKALGGGWDAPDEMPADSGGY